MSNNTCCFFGHRKINKTEKLKIQLRETIENLILAENITTFLFGSKSDFDDLCLELVTELKEKHPHIKRIYVRAEYPDINETYNEYLLKYLEDTYFPEKLKASGRAVYVERNFEMINKSKFCVVYYEKSYSPEKRKSGTKIALDYALKRKKEVIIFHKNIRF